MELQGKVALVTGGGRGIGRETSLLLAKHGAKVAVFSRSEAEVSDTANYITNELGGEAIYVTGDVRSVEDVKKAVRETREKLGDVDILVNNAGTMLLKPLDETTVEEWDFVQDINSRAHFLLAREVVPQMKENRDGVIVNISSIWGTKGGPDRSAYITSKFAAIGFSKALGEELKPYNVRVNAVCPGPVDTKMTDDLGPDLNKTGWLQPIDIAHVIVDLCLPKSVAVTATAVEAFGGGRPVGL
ncbi:dehydrogenase [Mesobacillus campisalis]|uniref:Dehydrogenase n=1 Tax=Mesobacillus campisalis TaxID=1408103 RepID=A0A0M2T2V8_9BACI|nr:SDR family oxidoreductase [Mesobacillus campisalis]KKK39145.1 dehydrogenase [Mesobacillus campisalis]